MTAAGIQARNRMMQGKKEIKGTAGKAGQTDFCSNSLLDNMPFPCILVGAGGLIRAFNRSAAELYRRISRCALKCDAPAENLIPADSRAQFKKLLAKAFAGERTEEEIQVGNKGKAQYYKRQFMPVIADDGRVTGVYVCHSEITGQKSFQNRLMTERNQLLAIFDSIDEPIYVADPKTYMVLYANNAAISAFGEIISKKCYRALQNLSKPCSFCTNKLIFGKYKGGTYTWEFQNRKNKRWYRCIDKAITWTDGSLVRYEMAVDISELKKAEEGLRLSRERYQKLFDNMSLCVAVYEAADNGRDFIIREFNKAAARTENVRAADIVGKNVLEVFPGIKEIGLLDVFRKVWRTGEPAHHPLSLYRDGRIEGWRENFVYRLSDREIVSVYSDQTERKKLEEELVRTQRLESLGQLAGGIAHDFNNILTVILGTVSLAEMYSPPDKAMAEALTTISSACEKAKKITNSLLTFSKGGTPVRRPVELRGIVENAAKSVLHGTDIRLKLDFPESLPLILADEMQMTQVFSNLLTNSRSAMPGGGEIEISARETASGGRKKGKLPLAKGRYVCVSVADTGIGIRKEDLPRIYDPYFTTKGKGCGLGLSVCHSIIRNHGGAISASSQPGKGATFTLYLPALKEKPRRLPAGGIKSVPEPPSPGLNVLVMDDNPEVLSTIRRMLKKLGCRITAAASGEEAVEIFKRARDKGASFDRIILDLTVPGGMDGVETLKRILDIDPDASAWISSGYFEGPAMAEYEKHGFKGVLKKPYTVQELLMTVLKE